MSCRVVSLEDLESKEEALEYLWLSESFVAVNGDDDCDDAAALRRFFSACATLKASERDMVPIGSGGAGILGFSRNELGSRTEKVGGVSTHNHTSQRKETSHDITNRRFRTTPHLETAQSEQQR